MIRFLPIIIPIIALIIAAVAFRVVIGGKATPTLSLPKQTGLVSSEDSASQILNNNSSLLSSDQRISIIEEAVKVLAQRVNNTTAITTNNNASVAPYGSTDDRLQKLEVAVTDIQTRLAELEKVTPTPTTSSSKSPLYIALGAGSSMMDNNDWSTNDAYDATINPASYPGYTSMQLEVNMRLVGTGTIYARLYNNTDSSAITGSVASSISSSASSISSSTFTLPSGAKDYRLQIKLDSGAQGFVNFARIKVNF